MSKKRFKKGKKGGFFSAIGGLFRGIGWLLWKALPLALIVGLIVFAGFEVRRALYADRFLRVQELKIVPPDVLSPQSIRTLEEKILNKNILLLDLRKIAAQIELGPGAQNVRVVREMPATVRVEIQKRKPIANVQLKEGGAYAIVAEDGVIIDAKKESDPAWILIEDRSEPVKEPKIGLRIQNKGFPEALRFMKVYRKHELARRETVTRISLDPYGNVTVRLGEGPDFQLGRKPSERLSYLVKALYLFETEPRENIEYMDLQYDRIAVKRKQ
ncbi:MAG TPA: FtsQ-type POTRA domain-containing protein [Candidatus Omnitrophota bacterium]|nr:FtsQ-type POTRA domain-containing protein [Candidatus Omnitrophota bacterium]HPS36751.1 FtsQ-type POTRA domain-containing protein [Candidatus Omnitrophota bacterium]